MNNGYLVVGNDNQVYLMQREGGEKEAREAIKAARKETYLPPMLHVFLLEKPDGILVTN